jgi:hypothetical protein
MNAPEMTPLAAHGLEVSLPSGWDGRIYHADEGGVTVLHAASFQLAPVEDDGDFALLSARAIPPGGSLAVLLDYGPEMSGEGLYAPTSVSLPIEPEQVWKSTLVESRPEQAAFQRFFSRPSRALTLYLTVSTAPDIDTSVADANEVLSTIKIDSIGLMEEA